MIHIVTVFFPPPGVKPWVARHFLLEPGLAVMRSFGRGRSATVPFKHHKWRTHQKNYLLTEISVWRLEKHELDLQRHMPPKDDPNPRS